MNRRTFLTLLSAAPLLGCPIVQRPPYRPRLTIVMELQRRTQENAIHFRHYHAVLKTYKRERIEQCTI